MKQALLANFEINRVVLLIVLLLLTAGTTFAQGSKKSDPCATAESQGEMNICARKKYQAADAKLNQVYRRLESILNDEQKAQLKDAQTAWLKYRDAHCEFVADEYKGGSIRPLIYAVCLEDVTQTRTAELKTQIKERTH